MSQTATYKFEIIGLDCANCAAELEHKISGIDGISNVSLNFMRNSLQYECAHDQGKQMEEEVRALIAKEEPDVTLTAKGHVHHHDHDHEEHHHNHDNDEHQESECQCHHEHSHEGHHHHHDDDDDHSECSCGHEHHHHHHDHDHDHEHVHHNEHHQSNQKYKLRIENIDCADCAAELETKIARLPGISNVALSFMNSTLAYDCTDPEETERKIIELVAREEPDAVVSHTIEKTAAPKNDNRDRQVLIRLGIGAVLFVIGLFTKGTLQAVVEIAAYLILGYDVLLKAIKGIGRGQLFDEHFLMSVATIAAMYLKDFREAAGVMLFYQIGEYFQERAVEDSRKSIGELMDIRPDYANVKSDGGWKKVSPEEVHVGDIIRVIPGERIPLDGVVETGASSLDTSSLTGESKLRDVEQGDEVISGSVNTSGALEIRVTKVYGDSTVARILDLVENQDSHKAKAENFITKFSHYYTPAVVFSAIAVAIIVALLNHDINEGIYRACTFLVISCPCALVISVPLSFFAGIGGLSKQGILVKGANLIEPLSKTSRVVFDKTGTLTQGVFRVTKITDSTDSKETLKDAAYAETNSTHPIALGITSAYGNEIHPEELKDVKEIAGRGTCVRRGDDVILAGNYKLMSDHGISCKEVSTAGTTVYVAKNGVYEGCIILADQLKEGADNALNQLRNANISCAIVSGDNREIAENAAKELGISEVHAECMPEDKVRITKDYCKEGITVFVGDGVNDAPVLAAADIGMAMGALGSDAAIEAADVVIMDDRPEGIGAAIFAAKQIIKVVNTNIYGAILIKVLTLIFGALGIANMWWAIFADTGVAMLCVLNAMRLLKIKTK